MAGQTFPGVIVPIIDPVPGPGTLHVHLGGEARLKSGEGLWFEPAWAEIDDVGNMFREFEPPRLRKCCQSMEFSLYRLDGADAIRNLDALLEIDEIHAVEWAR